MLHMIDAAGSLADFIKGRQRADLDGDRMLLFAVLRAIEVFGEAAGRVSQGTRATSPAIPWDAIVGMRNRLIHGYFNVDIRIVWKTITEEIPALLPALRLLV